MPADRVRGEDGPADNDHHSCEHDAHARTGLHLPQSILIRGMQGRGKPAQLHTGPNRIGMRVGWAWGDWLHFTRQVKP